MKASELESVHKAYLEIHQLKEDLIKALELADAFRCFRDGSTQVKEAEVDFTRLMRKYYYLGAHRQTMDRVSRHPYNGIVIKN